ncbi:MAG: radical SAM protein [Desulfurococcaceae archaeon TW002]
MSVDELRRIRAFIPGRKFVSVSITGTQCSLMCNYCRGYYLRGMEQAITPKQLYDLAKHLHTEGAKGILISGGFNKEGYLPIEPYINTIKEIKNDFGMIISIHTGLINKSLAMKLREAKVDVVDYELVMDDYVIKNIMHLPSKSSEDFLKTYEELKTYGPPHIIPHILVGANNGNIVKEFETIEASIDGSPEIIVFLIITPTRGAGMYPARIPSNQEVIKLINYARQKFNGEIALGCMRPTITKYTLDNELCELGIIDRIVNPLKNTINKFRLEVIQSCCSIPNELLTLHGLV